LKAGRLSAEFGEKVKNDEQELSAAALLPEF
jgi:hypothetical protein